LVTNNELNAGGKSMRMVLLGTTKQNKWNDLLKEALAPLGGLDVMTPEQAADGKLDSKYEVIALDATYIDGVERHISQLRSEQPDRRIVVLTAAPTWRSARAAFEAGAMDYLPKTLDQDELFRAFKELNRKRLPPWPR
jgi:DNA-binding response OmpR family regulator